MKLIHVAWVALCLFALAAVGVAAMLPRPTTATLAVGAVRMESAAMDVSERVPTTAYIAPTPEDPFTRTDELLREIDQKLSK